MSFLSFIRHKFFKKKFVCPAAFSEAYIYPDGRVFLCPDCFMHPDSQIGDLNKNTFSEIWNSQKAQRFRRNVLKGKYNYCSPAACFSKSNYNYRLIPNKNIDYNIKQKSFPKMVSISPDCECNLNCVMCRPCISRLSKEELKICKEKIEQIYIPILKDAQTLTVSTTADPLVSRSTRFLVKTAAQKYPDLKFNLITNGTLCNKFNCDDIGITDRLSYVMVSIHSSNEITYNNVVKNGNFKRVKENILWLKSLKESGKIEGLYLAFVISTKNYTDIPAFINFAKENNAIALFWACRDWGGNLRNSDEPLEIWRPSHPKYKELKTVLKSIELETDYSHFNMQFHHIRNN
ncbi:MAG: SPASM domain-containing protein [Bacilli bacterium]|nr:SPASM domain-containing protein [Bacilli bacterium]